MFTSNLLQSTFHYSTQLQDTADRVYAAHNTVCLKLLASGFNLDHILVHPSVFCCTSSLQMFHNSGGVLKRREKKKEKHAAGKSSPANAALRDLQMGQRCHTAFPSRSTSPKPMMEGGITLKQNALCVEGPVQGPLIGAKLPPWDPQLPGELWYSGWSVPGCSLELCLYWSINKFVRKRQESPSDWSLTPGSRHMYSK